MAIDHKNEKLNWTNFSFALGNGTAESEKKNNAKMSL